MTRRTNQIAPLILLSGADFLSVFTKPAYQHIVSLVPLPFMALREGSFVIWPVGKGAKVQPEEAQPSPSS